MKSPGRPVFLERDLYRRRRVIDAAKLLPILGLALFLLPVLTMDLGQPAHVSTSGRLIYFFSVWFFLIAIAFVLSRWLRPEVTARAPETEPRGEAKGPAAPES